MKNVNFANIISVSLVVLLVFAFVQTIQLTQLRSEARQQAVVAREVARQRAGILERYGVQSRV